MKIRNGVRKNLMRVFGIVAAASVAVSASPGSAAAPSASVTPSYALRNGSTVFVQWSPDGPGSYIQQCSDYGCDEVEGTGPGQLVIDWAVDPSGRNALSYSVRTGNVAGGYCDTYSWTCYVRVTYPFRDADGNLTMVYEKLFLNFSTNLAPYGSQSAWAYYGASRPVPTTAAPTTEVSTTEVSTTVAPTTEVSTTVAPTTVVSTTVAPTAVVSTTVAPTTAAVIAAIATMTDPTTTSTTTTSTTTTSTTTTLAVVAAPAPANQTAAPTTAAPAVAVVESVVPAAQPRSSVGGGELRNANELALTGGQTMRLASMAFGLSGAGLAVLWLLSRRTRRD